MRFDQAVDGLRQRLAQHGVAAPEHRAGHLLRECVAATHCVGAGMSLMTDGGARAVLAATDEVALQLEGLQFNFGEGPCTIMTTTHSPVVEPDLSSEPRLWSPFTAGAMALGVRAVFAFPLRASDVHLGALELYRTEPGPLSSDEYFEALVYAEVAVDLLVHRPSRQLTPLVTRALGDREEVYQAVGMVVVQAAVSPDEALALLRAHAFAHFQTVMEVALAVVEGTITLGSTEEDAV